MKSRRNWDAEKIKSFHKKILRWYRINRRNLPWRIDPTPYRVWISEIMLQQTQANTAAPYFERFVEEFPNVYLLARASENRVLELWAGLGYYSRARNLHKAARQIVKTHGKFPEAYNDILALPGVGRYTAGAICSLAFNHAQPAVDGNIRRVLTRLDGIEKHVAESYHWHQMSILLSKNNASLFTQAMMELGAVVCVPSRPRCPACPVKSFCGALEFGSQNTVPRARPRRVVETFRLATLVLEQNGRILLTSDGKPGFIPGKWSFPCASVSGGDTAEQVTATLCRRVTGRTIPLASYAQIRHSITNHRIFIYAFHARVDFSDISLNTQRGFRWASRSACKRFLTSSLFHKVLDAVDSWSKGEDG